MSRQQLLGIDSPNDSTDNGEDSEYDIEKRFKRQDGMLDNIISITVDTEKTGQETLGALDEQTDKITRIGKHVTNINKNISRSNRILKFIKVNEYKIKIAFIFVNGILMLIIALVIYMKVHNSN